MSSFYPLPRRRKLKKPRPRPRSPLQSPRPRRRKPKKPRPGPKSPLQPPRPRRRKPKKTAAKAQEPVAAAETPPPETKKNRGQGPGARCSRRDPAAGNQKNHGQGPGARCSRRDPAAGNQKKPRPGAQEPVAAAETPPPETKKTAAPADGSFSVALKVRSGRVRTEPSMSSSTAFGIPRGTRAKVTGTEGSWYHILLPDGRTGWSYKTMFDIVSEKDVNAPETQKNADPRNTGGAAERKSRKRETGGKNTGGRERRYASDGTPGRGARRKGDQGHPL